MLEQKVIQTIPQADQEVDFDRSSYKPSTEIQLEGRIKIEDRFKRFVQENELALKRLVQGIEEDGVEGQDRSLNYKFKIEDYKKRAYKCMKVVKALLDGSMSASGMISRSSNYIESKVHESPLPIRLSEYQLFKRDSKTKLLIEPVKEASQLLVLQHRQRDLEQIPTGDKQPVNRANPASVEFDSPYNNSPNSQGLLTHLAADISVQIANDLSYYDQPKNAMPFNKSPIKPMSLWSADKVEGLPINQAKNIQFSAASMSPSISCKSRNLMPEIWPTPISSHKIKTDSVNKTDLQEAQLILNHKSKPVILQSNMGNSPKLVSPRACSTIYMGNK